MMYRTLGAAAFIAFALAMPVQDAAAQDPLGGAILGGATGAIVGGALGGGRGAAIGAIVGGASGAAIAAQGQPRPGGYRYYSYCVTNFSAESVLSLVLSSMDIAAAF